MRIIVPLYFFLLTALAATTAAEPSYLGPSDLVLLGDELYVSEADAGRLDVLSLATRKVVRKFDLPGRPIKLRLSNDAKTFYVLSQNVKGHRSAVLRLDRASGKVLREQLMEHVASSLDLAPDGKTLLVANRFLNSVSVLDAASLKELSRFDVVREPIAVQFSPDAKHVVVANLLPATAATEVDTASAVTLFHWNNVTRKVENRLDIQLPSGSMNLREIAISPDSRYAYVTHLLGSFQLMTFRIEAGWMNANMMAMFDLKERRLMNTLKIDDPHRGLANPHGITFTKEENPRIAVVHSGRSVLSLIDEKKLLERVYAGDGMIRYNHGGNVGILQDYSPVETFRKIVTLGGDGARQIVATDTRAYITEYFSDTIAEVDLATNKLLRRIPLGAKPKLDPVRRGELLFHDAKMCMQGWQSCTSCHPYGRNDGLNWDLLNDGMNNNKNTKSLLFAHKTPPAMITGVRPTAEIAVRSGIRHILFAPIYDDQMDTFAGPIDAYLSAMRPIPSPYLVDGKLSAAAKRGKKVFEKESDCATCHEDEYYVDGLLHKMEKDPDTDEPIRFNTPTLREVWRTAPYLFDGRFTSIAALLESGKHGKTKKLSKEQLRDLAEYVLSL